MGVSGSPPRIVTGPVFLGEWHRTAISSPPLRFIESGIGTLATTAAWTVPATVAIALVASDGAANAHHGKSA